ncbi:MAG: hypothetical protein ACOCWC_06110 [Bacteroidota bacterium]
MIKKIYIALLFAVSIVLIINKTEVNAEEFIVDSSSTSEAWSKAKWTNYPNSPKCTPCTPQTALKNAKAGDTVYFRGGEGGNYDISPHSYITPKWNPSNSGTADAPITFKAYPGEAPVLKNSKIECSEGSERCSGVIIGSRNKDYIIWDGFQLGKTKDKNIEGNPVVYFSHCTGCALKNTEIHIVNNYDDIYTSNYAGLQLGHVNNIVIQNNYISGGTHMGEKEGRSFSAAMLFYLVQNSTIEFNTIYETANGISDKSTGRNNIYRNNFLYHPGARGIWFGGAQGEGSSARGNKAYNNIIVSNNQYCKLLHIDDDSSGDGHGEDFQIYNNVFYAQDKASVGIHASDCTNDHYWNNIFYGTYTTNIWRGEGPNGHPTYMDYNCYYSSDNFTVHKYHDNVAHYRSLGDWLNSNELVNGSSPDTHSLVVNPQFISPGDDPDGFKLQSSSKCLKNGKNGLNIGAYPNQEQNIQIGCDLFNHELLTAPSNLRIE